MEMHNPNNGSRTNQSSFKKSFVNRKTNKQTQNPNTQKFPSWPKKTWEVLPFIRTWPGSSLASNLASNCSQTDLADPLPRQPPDTLESNPTQAH